MENYITELEKHIYNKHLAVSRKIKNKPFKTKKDFSNIINSEKIRYLKRLAIFFKKHPDIDFDIFFSAPYKLYPDVEYFGLDYFSTLRAIKSYTLYKKMVSLQKPDEQLEHIKKSLEFIAKFCINHNLYFHQYSQHRTADLYTWMKHYKENKINIYVMFAFSNILTSVKSLAHDVQRFFLSEFVDQFEHYYSNFANSTETKIYFSKAIPAISNFIQKEVANKKK
jgi:hypothetical protein